VLDGVAEGDLVITAGQIKVQDGTPVQVVPPDGGVAGAGAANPSGGTGPNAGQGGAAPGGSGAGGGESGR
jgi:hypothetical protein